MAKKTKAERKAIRKQGWKDAGQGLHEMYGKSSLDTLAAMGKGFTKGVSSGRSSKNQPIRENMIGKGIAGLGGAVVEGLKNVPNTFKTMAKGTWKLIKGVFKGIFNHPDWWSYRNVLSIPAHNSNRPFDPVAIKSIAGTVKADPGVGVTHIVKQNVIYNDVRNTEAFKLASIEAFKAIRLDLRSNLPYTQEQYDNFIAVAMAVCAKAKALERTLGWYNVSRADIPELQDGMQSIPLSYSEVGKVTSNIISCISDSEYANTLNKYNKLQSICSNIAIPKKLCEYISWWLGSVFIDQAAPNAQLYVNELRACPVYVVDSNDEIVISEYWDILTGSIDTVINEALLLLNKFGIMNADIMKTGRYGVIDLANVEKGAYSPITLCDPEFFTILLNNYTVSRNDAIFQRLSNSEYVRVDVLEELSDANLVGVTNALAHWAQTVVPFEIVSQACYLTGDTTLVSPRNSNIIADISSADKTINQYVTANENYWFQITGSMIQDESVKILAASTSLVSTFTQDIKYSGSGIGTITAMGLAIKSFYEPIGSVDASFNGTIAKTIAITASNKFMSIVCSISSGSIAAISLNITPNKYMDWTITNTPGTTLHTLTVNTNYTVTSMTLGNAVFSTIFFVASTLTIASAARADVLSAFTVGSSIGTNVEQLLGTLSVTETTATTTATYKAYNVYAIDNFCDLVDYHLPILIRTNVNISNGSHALITNNVPYLKKATYVPLLFNYSDVSAVLYWMYLGLFSMD